MNTQQEEYIDLGVLLVDLLKGIKKFWYLLIILPLIGMVCVIGYQRSGYVPLYASQATFTVKTTGSEALNEINTVYNFYYDKTTAEHISATFPYILDSDVFKARLKEELGATSINGTISASVIKNSNLVTLKVTSRDPVASMEILTAVMTVYPDIARYVIGNNQFDVIDDPETLSSPVNALNYKKSAVIGIAIGLCVAFAIVLLYALAKKTVRTEKDMKTAISRPCLATLPEIKHDPIITRLQKDELKYSENVYSLQNRLDFLMKKNSQKVLLVTSTVPAEGKTTLSLNLAIAMARRGMKVLLIDGDLRNPALSNHIGTSAKKHTMNDVLFGQVSFAEAVQYVDEFSIYCLTCEKQSENSIALIQSKAMRQLVAKAREFADIVIIDTPPCGMLADAGSYSEYADSILMVVRQDWVSENKVMDAVLDLPGCGDKLIGCVLNMAKTGLTGYKYGYSSYGYGYSKYNRYRQYGNNE
jgi:capsular exopolysaccharide synthesis family protein